MIHPVKLALASVALAAVIAATPVVATVAHAEDAQTIELQNGAKVVVKGEEVFVVGADGTETPAPDGAHVAKDGTTITTKDGKIVK